jgi:hypothetical protein
MQGEALGAGVIGDLAESADRWAGPWRGGVRPGQGWRVPAEARTARAEAERGSRIR